MEGGNIMGKSLRMVMTVRPKKEDEDKIRDEKKEKLAKLQQKFLEKNKEAIKNNPVKENIIAKDKKKEFITKKITDKNFKQQLDSTNRKLEEFRDRDKKNKEIISRIKIQNSNLVSENNELKETNKELNRKANINTQEIEFLKKKLDEVTILYKASKRVSNNNALLLRDNKIIEQRKHINYMKNKIEQYKKKIKTLSTGGGVDIDYYNEKVSNYALENSKLRQQILELEQKNNKLSERLLFEVSKKDDESFNNLIHKRSYGILQNIEGKTYFIDVEGNKTIADVENIKFEEGVPCRVKFEEIQVARIQRIYDENDKFVEKVKSIDKEYKIKDNKEEFLYEGVDYKNLYNVLIIGSENKEQYTRVLKRIGLKVSWYDSFEGNVVRLRNMINRYDIVICCTNHCRHYASNLMTYMAEHDVENQIKYNLIENDNVYNIVGRTRYVIENLNE
jgi:hypothetical protein